MLKGNTENRFYTDEMMCATINALCMYQICARGFLGSNFKKILIKNGPLLQRL